MLNYFSKIQNFESNNTLDALNMYNKAVVFSPNTDDNLARACADRASCLLRLGDYARALADIEQAQQAVDEYQFERRFELDERKGLAYLGLGRLAEAAAAFTTAISLLEDGAGFLQRKFVERKMGELQDSLRACSGAVHNNGVSNCEVSSKFQSMKRLPELRGRNPRYPALTDKVDVGMTSTSSLFRGATARGGIAIGDRGQRRNCGRGDHRDGAADRLLPREGVCEDQLLALPCHRQGKDGVRQVYTV